MTLCSIRSLKPDRHIVLVDWYGHGVLWASIEDSEGTRAQICIDNRADSNTRGRIFDADRHPLRPGATLIELGDEVEGEIVALLSVWCDDPKHWQSNGGEFRDEFQEIFIETVSRIGAYS